MLARGCPSACGSSGKVTVSREKTMDSIIYLVGLVVVVLFILSMLGLR